MNWTYETRPLAVFIDIGDGVSVNLARIEAVARQSGSESCYVILSSGQRFPVGLRGPDGKPMTGDEFFSHVADVYAKGDR